MIPSTGKLTELTGQLAQNLNLGNSEGLIEVLKSTAFKGNADDNQMAALLIVANQYSLNPWTKEIYAFPDSKNGIVPIVGVDGWSRIINSHPDFDGMDFQQDEESCTCRIYRKDRSHPIAITEFMSECKRAGNAWQSHPKRMLRHKAMIQCARLAFGFAGIYDQDEAERIIEAETTDHVEIIQKRLLVKDSKEWERAISSLKQNGNLDKVKEFMDINPEDEKELLSMLETTNDPQQKVNIF